MSEYVMTFISVALLGALTSMLSPDGNTKKYVRLVGALCLLCALAAPIYGLAANGELDLSGLIEYPEQIESEYEDIFNEAIAEGVSDNAETALAAELCEKFDISSESLEVSLTLARDGEKYKLAGAEVILKSSAVFADPRDISAYVNEKLGCSCTVLYG